MRTDSMKSSNCRGQQEWRRSTVSTVSVPNKHKTPKVGQSDYNFHGNVMNEMGH